MTKSFWKFPACSKINELYEDQHMELILSCLADPETRIYPVDHDVFTVYGDTDALLIHSQSFPLRIILKIYGLFFN